MGSYWAIVPKGQKVGIQINSTLSNSNKTHSSIFGLYNLLSPSLQRALPSENTEPDNASQQELNPPNKEAVAEEAEVSPKSVQELHLHSDDEAEAKKDINTKSVIEATSVFELNSNSENVGKSVKICNEESVHNEEELMQSTDNTKFWWSENLIFVLGRVTRLNWSLSLSMFSLLSSVNSQTPQLDDIGLIRNVLDDLIENIFPCTLVDNQTLLVNPT